ncbi:MAG TPA: RcnB family protein [Luteimonas sp.]|nr:RcnB family protein [Luteimonas sp.]HRO27715.1 RcnB family protein [Luteimonas sp.]HRP71937.1 RcnB family protein [Luteimonas sp.]
MNQKLKWGTVLMLALATVAGPVFADNDRRGRQGQGHGYGQRDHDRRDDRRDYRRDYREARRDDRRDYRQDRRYDRRDYRQDRRHDRRDHRDSRRDYAYSRAYRAPARAYYPAPYYAPPPRWTRGSYVRHYRQPVYVVNDYYGYGLRQPPHGYRWMRDDYGDFLLVAIATGLIADLILRH